MSCANTGNIHPLVKISNLHSAHSISSVAIGCAGCAMHTGLALLGAQNLPDAVSSNNVECIRINLENHSLKIMKTVSAVYVYS